MRARLIKVLPSSDRYREQLVVHVTRNALSVQVQEFFREKYK